MFNMQPKMIIPHIELIAKRTFVAVFTESGSS